MDTRLQVVVIASSFGLVSACASESVLSSAPLICPDCAKSVVGEGSSATAGDIAGCSLAYLERDIDREEAESLGFPVTHAESLIEAPLDSAVTWVAKSTDGGGPASGYERETRIRGQLNVEAYNYRWLDPSRCDGTVCKVDGQEHEQAPCDERIVLTRVSGTLRTLDGAIAVRLPAQAVNIRRLGQVDDVVVAAAADLSEARGSLMIHPEVPAPRIGRVDLSLQFADSQHAAYGVLSVSVVPDWDNLAEGAVIAPQLSYYSPIEAQWGDPPSRSPSVVGP